MAISQIILIQRALAVRFKTLVIGSQRRTHGGQLKNTVTFFFFFFGVCHVPDILHLCLKSPFWSPLWRRHLCPHFTGEETSWQRSSRLPRIVEAVAVETSREVTTVESATGFYAFVCF